MKSMKKSLVFLMVFAMVLSTVAPVFAATPTDVVGTDYEDAVGKLVALGIISGYEDGSFKPENDITRAEFAKIACYVIGLQAAAELSKGTTKFSDVSASHWAAGFINVASEKGLIKGYPNGTFKPEAKVNYAEAITILVRALGMGEVVEGKGTWPANYLARASAAGLTDGVSSLVGNANALRGVIGQLAWNTLEAEKWGEKEYTSTGIVYGPLGKSLLEELYKEYVYKDANGKYSTKFFEDVEVIGTQLAGGYNSDEIRITKVGLNALLASNTETVEVVQTGIDLNALFGKKVDIMFGKDNKVAFIRVASTSENVVEGYITKTDLTNEKIEIDYDKEYSFKSDAKMYLNTKGCVFLDTTTTPATKNLPALAAAIGNRSAKATLILDSGKINAINIFVADDTTFMGSTTTQFIVDEINSNNEVKDTAGVKVFDIDDITTDTEKVVFKKNDKAATAKDIAVGNVVTYVKNGDFYYVVITDNKVTGKVTKIVSDKNADIASAMRSKITIDSKEYEMANDNSTLMTKTGKLDDVTAIDATINDFDEKEVTLSLNAVGRIVLVSGSVKGSASMLVGVVSKALWEGAPDSAGKTVNYIQIINPAGEKKAYTVKGDKYKDTPTGATLSTYVETTLVTTVGSESIKKGDIVLYDVSVDGNIDAKKLYKITGKNISDTPEKVFVKLVNVATESLAIKDKTEKVSVAGTDYFANSATTYFNCDTNDTDNPAKIADWAKLVSEDKALATNAPVAGNLLDNGNFYLVYDEDNMIKSIIINIDTTITPLLGSTAKYGVYIETQYKTDDDIITLYIDGKEVSYVVANDVYSEAVSNSVYFVEAGDLVRFELNGEGEFNGATGTVGTTIAKQKANFIADRSVLRDNEALADKVKSVNATSRIVTFEASATRDTQTTTSAVLASDVKIYDVRDYTETKKEVKMATIDDIAKGQFVVVTDYDTADGVFGVAVIVK